MAVTVEPAGKNAQRLYAGVDISAPVEVIWGALTDYDGLGTFIPGLSPCKIRVHAPFTEVLVCPSRMQSGLHVTACR